MGSHVKQLLRLMRLAQLRSRSARTAIRTNSGPRIKLLKKERRLKLETLIHLAGLQVYVIVQEVFESLTIITERGLKFS